MMDNGEEKRREERERDDGQVAKRETERERQGENRKSEAQKDNYGHYKHRETDKAQGILRLDWYFPRFDRVTQADKMTDFKCYRGKSAGLN